MNTNAQHKILIPALLLVLVLYGALVFHPVAMKNHVIGLDGNLTNGRYFVSGVMAESPAAQAGIQLADEIVSFGGRPIAELTDWYVKDISGYFDFIANWRGQTVTLEMSRSGKTSDVSINLRIITLTEILVLFGPRILFCLFLILMMVVISLSGTRSREARIFTAFYFFAVLWLLPGTRFWPDFGFALVPDVVQGLFRLQVITSIISLQLSMGALLLVSLRFPRKLPLLDRFRGIQATAAILPLGMLLLATLPVSGSYYEFVIKSTFARLWIDSIVLVCTLVLFIWNYRTCESALHREQSRWIIVSYAIATIMILCLWTLPIVIFGKSLVGNFDWLLIPIALLPLSMTLAINNHRLFGIHGIVGYRLKVLESRLNREKLHVQNRDKRIKDLDDDLNRLRSELADFTENEISTDSSSPDSRLLDLENRFPQLRDVRKKRLLGASRLWTGIFEEVIVASFGTVPVLIFGESGTGKTDIARAVHQLGDRQDNLYREISCAQFEHADPAIALGRIFGITPNHGLANVPREGQVGLLEECANGTLFMDDFDCLPGNVQNLMLYPLEGKPFEPGIGRGPSRQVSVKFILATNRSPEDLVIHGKLRGDVLARLGNRIILPPLRDRPEDIPILVSHFIGLLASEMDCEKFGVSTMAMSMLRQYDYRNGNARQLMSALRQAMGRAILEKDSLIRADYLAGSIPGKSVESAAQQPDLPEGMEGKRSERSGHTRDKTLPITGAGNELDVLRRNNFRIAASEKELGLSLKSRTLSNHLRGICIQALQEHDWEVHHATLAIVGSGDRRLVRKIESKMIRYLDNIKKRTGDSSEEKLYNNLPARYHDALSAAITTFRNS